MQPEGLCQRRPAHKPAEGASTARTNKTVASWFGMVGWRSCCLEVRTERPARRTAFCQNREGPRGGARLSVKTPVVIQRVDTIFIATAREGRMARPGPSDHRRITAALGGRLAGAIDLQEARRLAHRLHREDGGAERGRGGLFCPTALAWPRCRSFRGRGDRSESRCDGASDATRHRASAARHGGRSHRRGRSYRSFRT